MAAWPTMCVTARSFRCSSYGRVTRRATPRAAGPNRSVDLRSTARCVMIDDADELTEPVEDYLKAVYALERERESAATNDIAQRLGVAPASVSGMVRRLADAGLLEYERYRGVKLTESGRRAALRTLRRHRVIEAYLA